MKTRYGTFNGFVDKNGVKTWLGIPFAQPPVKKLRWQAPQPLKPSNKSFGAKKFGFTAVQDVDKTEGASVNPQSEDCLTLNIWRRGDKKNLPVMVWIHGGGFVSGGSSDPLYNGSNFAAANDTVIVTINYLLNVFGFFNLASVDSAFSDSGYLGTKDQVAALTWVKENIAEFGGNPDNVTIFGESAGAVSTMLLMVIPAAKNLFQKSISQSGHTHTYNIPEKSAQFTEIEQRIYSALGKIFCSKSPNHGAELERLRLPQRFEHSKLERTALRLRKLKFNRTLHLGKCRGNFLCRRNFLKKNIDLTKSLLIKSAQMFERGGTFCLIT